MISSPGKKTGDPFNTAPGFFIEFESTGGDLDITGSQGQARIEGLNESTYTHLSFWLTDDSTFTKARLNVNAAQSASDAITFSILYSGGGRKRMSEVQASA